MSESNTVLASVYDPKGAAVNATDRRARLTQSSLRWALWSLAGGITTADKAGLTTGAMAGTAASPSMGRRAHQLADEGAPGATETRARRSTVVDVGAEAVRRVSVGQPGPDRWTRGTGRAAAPGLSAGLSLVEAAP
jgi:hypothetical protein